MGTQLEAAAHKLLDFSQPTDVAVLDHTVSTFYEAPTPEEVIPLHLPQTYFRRIKKVIYLHVEGHKESKVVELIVLTICFPKHRRSWPSSLSIGCADLASLLVSIPLTQFEQVLSAAPSFFKEGVTLLHTSWQYRLFGSFILLFLWQGSCSPRYLSFQMLNGGSLIQFYP